MGTSLPEISLVSCDTTTVSSGSTAAGALALFGISSVLSLSMGSLSLHATHSILSPWRWSTSFSVDLQSSHVFPDILVVGWNPTVQRVNQLHSQCILGVFDRGISESNFWPRPLRIRACVISTSSFQSNGNEWKRSVYKMAGEIQNRRGVKSKLSVVGLLIELMSDGDDESEEYNDDSLLMEIAVSRWCTSTTKVVLSNIAHADASSRHLHETLQTWSSG